MIGFGFAPQHFAQRWRLALVLSGRAGGYKAFQTPTILPISAIKLEAQIKSEAGSRRQSRDRA